MRLRTLAFVVLLVGGFWFTTTHWTSHLDRAAARHIAVFGGHEAGSPLELTEAEAAPAYDAEEQNNIAVY